MSRPALNKTFLRTVLAGMLAMLLVACSQDSPDAAGNGSGAHLEKLGLVEGTHYKKIDKPVFEIGEKFIVHEFFWYGCPHCLAFEPALHNWKKSLLGAVIVEQVPAMWAEPMELHAKAFYIAETLPREQREALHEALFQKIIEIRSQRDVAKQQSEIAAVFAQHGLDREAFEAALNDASMSSKIERAKRMMKGSGASSTPALMVNGRYLVLNDTAKQADDITALADRLIRAERKRMQSEKQ